MAASDKAPKDPAATRETKLAEALRANLRRRKAGAAQKPLSRDKGETARDG